MIKSIVGGLTLFLIGWWIIHIVEGQSSLDKANRACDPIYWFGKFSYKEIAQGYTSNKKEAYSFTEGVTNFMGGYCFKVSSGFFKAVNPNWNFDEVQLLNKNSKGKETNPEDTVKAFRDKVNGIDFDNKKDN